MKKRELLEGSKCGIHLSLVHDAELECSRMSSLCDKIQSSEAWGSAGASRSLVTGADLRTTVFAPPIYRLFLISELRGAVKSKPGWSSSPHDLHSHPSRRRRRRRLYRSEHRRSLRLDPKPLP